MCAMMPMFRVFSRGYCASTARLLPKGGGGTQEKRGARSRPPRCISSLPAIMRERLVGLRHLVSVFSLLHGGPSVVGRVQQLAGQLVGHAALRASARRPDQPPHAQRGAPIRPDLDRDLIGGAAHPPRLDLDGRLAVVHRALEQLQRFLPGAILHRLQGVVHDPLRGALLAPVHHHVHELRHQPAPVRCLAPYFDRLCRRPATPAVSSEPRMMWYRMPGRSFTRPPRMSTIECSCRLWPTPGMYEVTSRPLVRRTRATLRRAEFGFFGVWVRTTVHTPRFWGAPLGCWVRRCL